MKAIVFMTLGALGLVFFTLKKQLYTAQKSTDGIIEILENRYSGNEFDIKKDISDDQIKSLIYAAQLTPSSHNEQPWNFIICDKKKSPHAYNKALSALALSNKKWAQQAPVLVIIAASQNSHKNNKPNAWASYDTGAAAFSMAIQATALGLMTHQIAGFDNARIKCLFTIPPDVSLLSIMAIGYPNVSTHLPKPRERKQTYENFFQADWGLK